MNFVCLLFIYLLHFLFVYIFIIKRVWFLLAFLLFSSFEYVLWLLLLLLTLLLLLLLLLFVKSRINSYCSIETDMLLNAHTSIVMFVLIFFLEDFEVKLTRESTDDVTFPPLYGSVRVSLLVR